MADAHSLSLITVSVMRESKWLVFHQRNRVVSGLICVQAPETNRFNGLTSGIKNVWMKQHFSIGKSAGKALLSSLLYCWGSIIDGTAVKHQTYSLKYLKTALSELTELRKMVDLFWRRLESPVTQCVGK